jgi:hypothetical protein
LSASPESDDRQFESAVAELRFRASLPEGDCGFIRWFKQTFGPNETYHDEPIDERDGSDERAP